MKKKLSKVLVLMIVVAFALTGCFGSSSSDDVIENGEIGTLSGQVNDADGGPVKGLTVIINEEKYNTGSDGTYSLSVDGEYGDRIDVDFEWRGYDLDAKQSFVAEEDATNNFQLDYLFLKSDIEAYNYDFDFVDVEILENNNNPVEIKFDELPVPHQSFRIDNNSNDVPPYAFNFFEGESTGNWGLNIEGINTTENLVTAIVDVIEGNKELQGEEYYTASSDGDILKLGHSNEEVELEYLEIKYDVYSIDFTGYGNDEDGFLEDGDIINYEFGQYQHYEEIDISEPTNFSEDLEFISDNIQIDSFVEIDGDKLIYKIIDELNINDFTVIRKE